MDKVKVFLGYAQKYHFWILCVVAMIAGLVGWKMASGTLSEQYATNKGSVTSKFQTLQGIRGNQFPPNSEWTTAIASLTERQREEVKTTWESVYETQRKVLSWPDVIPENFKRFIETAPPNAEFPQELIRVYQNEVIKHEFPKLAEIVNAAPADPASQPKRPEGTPPPVYKVIWENQEDIKKKLDEGMTGGTPSTLQVRLRQEDLWVYQALLNIIRQTNEGALYTSRVKAIENLAMGAHSAPEFEKGMSSGHIKRLTEGVEGETYGAPPADMSGGEPGAAPPPDEGRYMDAEGKILAAGMSQDQQFKRLPVYMKLVMDQREITRLLTECANYPLPVEVRQLRINPGGVGPSGAADAGKPGANRGAAAPSAPGPGDAFNVIVELHGIIYLFNPPDPAKLGADTAAQSAG
jgi:hypothetical protein